MTSPASSAFTVSSRPLVSDFTSTASSSQSTVSSTSVGSTGWLPARNPYVNHTSPDRLIPTNVVALYYVEKAPGTRSKLDTITLKSGTKGILLEDISTIDTVTCSDSKISISFTDAASAAIAKTWPAGTLLFTFADGCNTASERGVYSVNSQGDGKSLDRRLTVAELLQLAVTREDLQALIAALVEVIQQMSATSTTPSVSSTILPSSVQTIQTTQQQTPQRLCGGFTTGRVSSSAGDPWDVYCGYKGTAPLKQYNPYNPQLSSMEDCFAYCKKTTNCMAVQWNQNNKGGECIPFTMLGLPDLSLHPANGLYDVAYLVDGQSPSTQASTAATITASSSSTVPYPRWQRVSTADTRLTSTPPSSPTREWTHPSPTI